MLLGVCLAVFVGIFSSLYAGFVGKHYGLLLGLPGAMLIGLIFLFDRYLLVLLVILFRSAMDPVFEATKLGSFGLGAVLNALIILIALIAIYEFPNPVRDVLKKTWLGFLGISFITLFLAPDAMTAIKTYLALLSYAAVFALAICVVRNEQDYGRWMKAIFFSSLIPVVYAFVDIATGGYHGHEEEGFRISSTFAHPNVFAFYLVLMISVGFYFYISKVTYLASYVRKVIPLYIFIMLALLLMTKTRSAWAACFAFFTLYAIVYDRKYLIFICLAPVVAFFIPDIRDRFMNLAQGNEVINYSQLNSYAWRKLIWHDGLTWMHPGHYFFGYGLESFKYHSIDFFTMAGGANAGAHSVYVQLFFETGVLGVLAFIWVHFRVATLLAPFYQQNKLMIFSGIMFILEFATEAYSDNMLAYLSFNWYLWFVLGAAYAVNYSMHQRKINMKDELVKA